MSILLLALAVAQPPPVKLTLLKTFRDEFVSVTPGEGKHPHSFQMGRADAQQTAAFTYRGERLVPGATTPVRRVTFDYDFAIAKYEVPQNLWQAVMGANPSRWKGPRNSVEMLSFEEANEFCRRATRMMREAGLIEADQEIRLPSEAEWEYAARAGTNTTFSFGDDLQDLNKHAWHTGNAAGNDPAVGEKAPNPWGLYDIHGYLWEWCADPWHEDYTGAPGDGSVWTEDADFQRRVLRGGSWKDPAVRLGSAFRVGAPKDLRDDAVGLRCVLAPASR